MKKIFTLVAMATMAFTANAQMQSAFMDVETLGIGSSAVSVAAGTTLCSSANVTMKAAYACDYKSVAMNGENDAFKTITIDGTEFSSLATGVQGQSNPTNTKNATTQQPVDNAIFRFDVTADGYLYVFSKLSANKQYYAFEGEYSATTSSDQLAYDLVMGYQTDGNQYAASLPGDADGYADYSKDPSYPFTTIGTYFLADMTGIRPTTDDNYGTNTWADSQKGNGLGVVGFPVYADAGTYYFFAVGSKVTCDGFAFVPGATAIGSVTVSGATAVQGVAEAKAEVAAPVKVIGKNGIQIGNFNVAGQQVK
ncbi:MAG: hypothetical protein IJ897_05175 [Prevotella sp.]|nr:hypothetical protein [Prevotella sp.]MBR4572738.1 hypothetical protein [Prevotella sp.]